MSLSYFLTFVLLVAGMASQSLYHQATIHYQPRHAAALWKRTLTPSAGPIAEQCQRTSRKVVNKS